MNGVSEALTDVTNTFPPLPDKSEMMGKARERGWKEPTAYDYSRYAADPTNAANAADAVDPTDTVGPREVEDEGGVTFWGSAAAKYEWSDEYGDVGPRNPELEKMLFEGEYIQRSGVQFEHLTGIKVTVEGEDQPRPINQFQQAGLHPIVVENIRLCQYTVPTPVQAYVIPAVLKKHDVIAVAQTGTVPWSKHTSYIESC